MADDAQEILGKWTVKVQTFVWEYEFLPGGKLNWRDPRSREHGTGHWSLAPKLINLSWSDSSTTESIHRPITPAKQKGWYSAPYYTGNYELQKVVTAPSAASDVDPSVANLPNDRYVDLFTEAKYDINYKIPLDRSFAFSSILQLKYGDGVALELDFEKELSDEALSSDEVRDSMAHASLGRGGRIFPTKLTFGTVPRLWRARADALQQGDDEAKVFMGMAVTATAVVVGVPAMPAGAPQAAVASKGVTRRPVPGTRVPPAPIQGNAVRLGSDGPGTLWSYIHSTGGEVVYYVTRIILQGKGAGVATARATHREMIRRAAQAARAAGQRQFKVVGVQAGPNFVKHANKLADEIGVAGSGKGGVSIVSDYTVILDVAKTLGAP